MMLEAEPLYTRQLPGGGYVAIEATTRDDAEVSLRLYVERRVDPKRRTGHQPPVVAEVSGVDRERAVRQLVRIAENNVEVARALQRWQVSR
ncbi:MAG TPA: hypothetical protein VFA43_21915 [Gemmatimonadaceae bacterium]|nr:hypothetical protein [Gemmatimonadaceae bacterium]